MDRQGILLQVLSARYGLPVDRPREELLAQLLEQRPDLRMIWEVMSTSTDEAPEEQEEIPEVGDFLRPTLLADEAARRTESLALQRASRLVEALRFALRQVAAALGACPQCWGRDAACRQCHGAGVPGSASPDSALFREIALPAFRRWRDEAKSGVQAPTGHFSPDPSGRYPSGPPTTHERS